MTIKDGDLVLATQGRGFWILDDLSPVRQWQDRTGNETISLFQPAKAIRYPGGSVERDKDFPVAGKNGPGGAVIDFWLKEKPSEKEIVKLEILERDRVLRTFTNEKKDKEKDKDGIEESEKPLELVAGVNRFIWDLRGSKPDLVPKAILWGDKRGPRVATGTYTVRLTASGKTLAKDFEVAQNPAISVSAEDLAKQAALLSDIRDRLSETHFAVRQIRDLTGQIDAYVKRAEKAGKAAPLQPIQKALIEKLAPLEEKLVNPKLKAEQDVLNFTPGLDHQFAGIASAVSSAAAPPTAGAIAYHDTLKKELDATLSSIGKVFAEEVPKFNAALKEVGIEPVSVMAK
jgi:hypothetical protein